MLLSRNWRLDENPLNDWQIERHKHIFINQLSLAFRKIVCKSIKSSHFQSFSYWERFEWLEEVSSKCDHELSGVDLVMGMQYYVLWITYLRVNRPRLSVTERNIWVLMLPKKNASL